MKGIRIRPEKEGLKTSLFDLEADIMDVVWDQEWSSFAVGDVHKVLEQSREIAYTTVMTTVKRLHDKGLLDRHKDGRRYLYQPLLTRDEFIRQMTRDVLDSLPDVGKEEALAMLVEQVAAADMGELEKLEALIRARRRERQEQPATDPEAPDG